eukprot:4552982-Prorocentrum_lima.AAC.1
MWKKTHGWRFYCEVDWSVLEREGQKDRSDKNPVTVWYRYMKEKFTTQVDNWPKIGCGARFMPRGRGSSMVMDMQMKDGTWEAYMAD